MASFEIGKYYGGRGFSRTAIKITKRTAKFITYKEYIVSRDGQMVVSNPVEQRKKIEIKDGVEYVSVPMYCYADSEVGNTNQLHQTKTAIETEMKKYRPGCVKIEMLQAELNKIELALTVR